jgi:GT2 family glycosyltransferase
MTTSGLGGEPPCSMPPIEKPHPEISVVVAVGDLRQRGGECLRTLLAQGLGYRMEILLLDRGGPDAPPVPHADSPHVRRLPQPPEATFSAMRTAGVAAARAPVVAFVEEHVRVRPGWAEAILAAFRDGWDGVGAAVVPGNPGAGRADAVCLISYGLWYPPFEAGEATMLPGHNASYRTEVLRDLGDELEPLLHVDLELQARLRRQGRRLFMQPEAVIEHLSESSFAQLSRGIHLWYRCYGPLRARRGGWSLLRRALYVVATPLVPFYFLAGFALHLRRSGSPHLGLMLRNVPGVLRTHLWGAAGQALGLLFGEGDAAARFTDYELHEPRPFADVP